MTFFSFSEGSLTLMIVYFVTIILWWGVQAFYYEIVIKDEHPEMSLIKGLYFNKEERLNCWLTWFNTILFIINVFRLICTIIWGYRI